MGKIFSPDWERLKYVLLSDDFSHSMTGVLKIVKSACQTKVVKNASDKNCELASQFFL